MKPCPDTFPFPLVALDETASTNQYLSQLRNQLQESVAEPIIARQRYVRLKLVYFYIITLSSGICQEIILI